MTKMTPAQKAANKAAQSVRDRAFTARLREYRSAMRAAEDRVEQSQVKAVADAAAAELDAALRERNVECAAIQEQIDALIEKQNAVRADYQRRQDSLRMARNEKWDAWRALRDAEFEKVNDAYADVSNIFYVSQWKIPCDVQAAMDAAAKGSVTQ